MQIINFYSKNKRAFKYVRAQRLVYTIYKRIHLFQLDFYVIQKYSH